MQNLQRHIFGKAVDQPDRRGQFVNQLAEAQ